MGTIVLDEQTVKWLDGVRGHTEVREESGRLCGLYFPAPSPPYVPESTNEELDRAAAAPGGRSLAEILADLRARP
jgi:hypothetical protein